ncbi:MAG TPA: PAS domain S-box protein [Nitrospiraceae bacterium]|nr:PAS domain S-box protein [Nitrospiraceae bacterium]
MKIFFENIFEASKDAIGYATIDGTILLINRAFSELTGYSREELLTMNVRDLIPEQHRKQRDDKVAQVLQTGEPGEYEIEYLRKNGSRVPVSITVFAVKRKDGKSTGLAAIVRDLTERKHAEEQFRLVVESSPSGVLMVDEQGTIRMVNRKIDELFGYERAELIGQSVEILVPQHMRSHHAGDRAEFIAHSESRAMGKGRDLYGVRKDGQEFPLEIGLNPIRTPDGLRVLASVVDITERKHIQKQLWQAERLAELGTLASGMAHEIGTPMNVILGRAEYLLQRTADEGMKKGLTTIVTQIERITKVMNQLLAFARRRALERRPVDLGEIVDDALEMFQERIAHNRITVDKAIEANMPSVHADRDQLVQVLINLVMNSLHAMPEGGRLRLSLAREGSYVCLGLSDTGHGMTEEIRSKVFDPFFTTKDFGKGTGLGLTVVKGIVEEHGGTIAVESVVDKGTTFWIRLPLDIPQIAAIS